MGYNVTCRCTLAGQTSEGRAELETDFLQFRSTDFRFKVLLPNLQVRPLAEDLEIQFDRETALLHLGEKAVAKWADKILNPPTLLAKLGIKPDSVICKRGEVAWLTGIAVSGTLPGADLIFLGVGEKSGLQAVPEIAGGMRRTAALWIVYPKGRTEIREIDVIDAGRHSGLKDVKVVRFSDTATALKFVVPITKR